MSDPRFQLPEINTWRLYAKGVTQERVMRMVEDWEIAGYRFGTVCVDDGWTVDSLLGDWQPCPRRFPDLGGLADWLHRKGYALRLWVAPAQIHPDTRAFGELFPAAVLRNRAGQPALNCGLRSFRLDIRHGEARRHIRETMQRLVRDYRVDGFKVDFPPFYHPGDEYYREHCDYDLPESDQRTMVQDFYRLIRESIDTVNPAVRVQCARHLAGCQPFINDTICGDLIGCERNMEVIGGIATELNRYCAGHDITPWLEMVWGEGTHYPSSSVEWHAGFLEWIALSINFGLKIEHSFPPFRYPNAEQIRALTNLYGPRDTRYKVLQAGRQTFPVASMIKAGLTPDARTRFLVAPEDEVNVSLHTGLLRTNAVDWHCRNVLTGAEVPLRARNEFWSNSTDHCRVVFEAQPRQVYELWYEGAPAENFLRWFEEYPWHPPSGEPAAGGREAD